MLAAGRSGARPAVVICHGRNASKDWGFFPPTAERLARAGFSAISFTFPGSPALRDLDIVLVALIRGQWGAVPSAVGLLGHSLGGAIGVQRAARDPQVAALVTWGAPASQELLRAAEQVRAPWLIVQGDKDESVPVQAAHDLKRAATAAVSELLLVKGGSHTFSVGDPWQGPTRAFDVALNATVDWFAKHLA
jgi:dienelactone hydrolase